MDFFRVLVKNNMRTLPEVVVSSFLNYLLCPEEDHGFGGFFLERFLCEFGLAPEGLEKPSDWRWPRPPKVYVFPEWPCERDDDGNQRGFMDSLLVVTQGNQVWLYGIEVKIHDKSARNESAAGVQLKRYGDALRLITAEGLVNEFRDKGLPFPPKPRIEQRTLLFLVPGEANVWPAEVRRTLHEDPSLESILKVITWRDTSAINELSVAVTGYCMDNFLRKLLCACQDGSIPPPDLFVVHMLRCLRYAIESDFTYRYEVPPVFPSNADFEKCLREHGQFEVLALIRAVNEESVHGRLYARSHHTSIGIPIAPSSVAPPDNTLCRIRTVNSYFNPEILEHIQIEIASKQKWEESALVELLNELTTQSASAGVGLCFEGDFGAHFHQNGKDSESVWLINIRQTGHTPAVQDDVARDQVRTFFKWLRSAYTTGENL